MAIQGFGKPTAGGPKYKHFKLEVPKNVDESSRFIAAVLPPIHKQAAKGIWVKYLKKHFGYKGHDDRDPTKLRLRVFGCHEERNNKTKMILRECSGCDKIAAVTAERDAAKAEVEAAIKAGKLTAADGKDALASFETWIEDHNVDRKYTMWVVTPEGEPGDLAIGVKAMAQLRSEMDKLKANGFTPIDCDNGVFFEFTRTKVSPRRGDVTDKVMPAFDMERDAQGRPTGKQALKLLHLTEEQQIAILETLPDLTDLVDEISAEDMKAIVDSDGDPDVVDRVFKAKDDARNATAKADSGSGSASTSSLRTAASTAGSAPVNKYDDVDPESLADVGTDAADAKPAAKMAETPPPAREEKVPVSPGATGFLATLRANGAAGKKAS